MQKLKNNLSKNLVFKVSVLIVLISGYTDSVVICQTFKTIGAKTFSKFNNLRFNEDTVGFNGYLIFRIHKSPNMYEYTSDSLEFTCDVYWIEDINKIKDENNFYFYNTFLLPLELYVFTYDTTKHSIEENVNFHNFKFFLDIYKDFYNKNITVRPFLFKQLTTELFYKGIEFYNFSAIDSVGYYIFKNSFEAVSLNCDFQFLIAPEKSNENNVVKIKDGKVLIPVSVNYELYPVDKKLLEDNNFTVSNWLPSNLYK